MTLACYPNVSEDYFVLRNFLQKVTVFFFNIFILDACNSCFLNVDVIHGSNKQQSEGGPPHAKMLLFTVIM